MSVFNNAPEVEIRERRLRSIISYHGTGKDLFEKEQDRSFKIEDRSFSQCSSCPEGPACTIVTRVRESVVIFHSPIGCNAASITYGLGVIGAAIAKKEKPFDVHTVCTNLQESDTIFGAGEKLKKTAREAHKKWSPKVIFINTSCASGIIGENIEDIAAELEEELGVQVAPIYCEGFRSKIWSTGFDAGYHGILRKIVKPPQKKQEDLVNVFGFDGSDTFSPVLSRLGLRTNYLISLASIEKLETMSEAACTASICETLSLYVAAVLEEQYGVPEVKAPPPYGIDWTDEWLRAVGKITGREEAVERLIREDKEKYQGEMEELASKLSGKTIYVTAGDAFGHNLANVAKSLGVKIAGITSLHHDLMTDNPESVNSMEALVKSNGDIPNFSVCNLQPYQVVKILKKLKPDFLYCRHPGLNSIGSKLGIPTLVQSGDANYTAFYEGVVKLGRKLVETHRTRKLVENISRHIKLPYTDWWMSQDDPFYFEKTQGENT
jgi:nitrogenase molybdenum-iron protein alpha chain